ncbi:MAG: PTS sugar transporter subunit IIA [Treponema sp.]|jgi:PTS system galactitol-specific IIA component|nr:PTS sugar transporter subunit IIA [Treponema sp.]
MMLAVTEDNILVNLKADSKEEVLHNLVDLLVKNGYITPDYYDVLIAREKKYPTGLPTEGIKVAIPHGFSDESVIKPAVGIATLANPVKFNNMFEIEQELAVGIVFLLALSSKEKDKHGKDLARVMGVFSDADLLSRLQAAKTGNEVTQIMSEPLKDI